MKVGGRCTWTWQGTCLDCWVGTMDGTYLLEQLQIRRRIQNDTCTASQGPDPEPPDRNDVDLV
jgi:hypothetical protein